MRNQYITLSDIERMPLAEIERYLTEYLAIAEASDWDITPAFERELVQLTRLAKIKGSTKRW